MATALRTIQDARRAPLKFTDDDVFLVHSFGDSNGVGFDTTTTDWSPNVSDLPTGSVGLGVLDFSYVWNKWTVGANAARSSDADTGTGWHTADVGLYDHGASTYLGLGQNARSNGPESAFCWFIQDALSKYLGGSRPKVYCVKYGVPGSVIHPTPASPASGWHPATSGVSALDILLTRYFKPAITNLLANVTGRIYYLGGITMLGGTDGIDPGGVFTEPGDAEAAGGNYLAVLDALEQYLGVHHTPITQSVAPISNELAASSLGYPNQYIVRDRIAGAIAKRNARHARTAMVDPSGLERISDYLHYTNKGQWWHGRNLARAHIEQGLRLQQITEAPV